MDDLLTLCGRCGLRLFDDYIVDRDLVVVTEAGQRKLEAAAEAADDDTLALALHDAAGVEAVKLLARRGLTRSVRRRLRRSLRG
jgi:hypothetical protein